MAPRTRWPFLTLCAVIVLGIADLAGATVVVEDYDVLEVHFQKTRHILSPYLAVEGGETPIDGEGVLDILGVNSPFTAVTVHFQPPADTPFRICVRPGVAATWTCTLEGIGAFAYAMEVPEAGLTKSVQYYAEMAGPEGSTIASHGYIRVKKLNTGG